MNYVDFFYSNIVGSYPNSNDEYKIMITKSTIDYLLDNNFSANEIIEIIKQSNNDDCLYPSSLPDSLWDNSLIKRNHFYYHKRLQIISKAPTFDIKTNMITTYPFYKEIIINFTIEDLINYFFEKMHIDKELIDIKKNGGSFNYILKKYAAIKDIEALDLVLIMIDISKHHRVSNIISIEEYSREALETLRMWQKEAKSINANKIIWRSSQWMKD